MNTKEYIESGNLELYVYGLLNDDENKEISDLAKKHKEIYTEIVSIEKAVLNLSSSFSPQISAEVFEKTKQRLQLGESKVINLKPKSNRLQYLGWAASAVLFLGLGYQYLTSTEKINQINNDKIKLEESMTNLDVKNKNTEKALTIIRDANNTVVNLGGQAVSPTSFAKVYWNKETQVVYVDASGLPKPPKGKVYQVWSLKLSPTLTPTSIGLLDNFENADNQLLFAVSKTSDAEAFGITLEPAGGSLTPTMEQLYTLGKV
jgi:anti-sigma-K factor RskA